MRLLKKIYHIPYFLSWVVLCIFIIIYNRKQCKALLDKFLHYKGDVDLEVKMKEEIKEVVWDYILVMEKLKPHIAGAFWLIFLLLIFK